MLESKVRYLNCELSELREIMLYTKPNLDGPIDKKPKPDAFENAIILIQEYYDEINDLIVELSVLKRKLWMFISLLPTREMIDVMACILMEKKSFEEVADKVGCSSRTIRRVVQKSTSLINSQYEDPVCREAVDVALTQNRLLYDVLKDDFNYDCGQLFNVEMGENLLVESSKCSKGA